jgi:hypothetical protein
MPPAKSGKQGGNFFKVDPFAKKELHFKSLSSDVDAALTLDQGGFDAVLTPKRA